MSIALLTNRIKYARILSIKHKGEQMPKLPFDNAYITMDSVDDVERKRHFLSLLGYVEFNNLTTTYPIWHLVDGVVKGRACKPSKQAIEALWIGDEIFLDLNNEFQYVKDTEKYNNYKQECQKTEHFPLKTTTRYRVMLQYFVDEEFDTKEKALERLAEIKEKAKKDTGWKNASKDSKVVKVTTIIEDVAA